MENNEKEKKSLTAISDEALEGVTGGTGSMDLENYPRSCPKCGSRVSKAKGTMGTSFEGHVFIGCIDCDYIYFEGNPEN